MINKQVLEETIIPLERIEAITATPGKYSGDSWTLKLTLRMPAEDAIMLITHEQIYKAKRENDLRDLMSETFKREVLDRINKDLDDETKD